MRQLLISVAVILSLFLLGSIVYPFSRDRLDKEKKTILVYLEKAGAKKAELDTLSILFKTNALQSEIQKRMDLIIQRRLSQFTLEQQRVYYTLAEDEQLVYLATSDPDKWIKKRYNKLIEKLCSTKEGKIQYYSLENLLTKEELKDFIIQDSLSRIEWLKKYWSSKDPTLTTEKNEWKEEFERRVTYSLENFHSNFGLKPWDDRGDVLIKLGEPDERKLEVENPYIPVYKRSSDSFEKEYQKIAGETWGYTINGKDVCFQFQDSKGIGYLTLVPYISGNKIQDLDYVSNFLAEKGKMDQTKARYYHDYGGKALDFAWEIIKFRIVNNVYEVLVNIGIPADKLGKDSTNFIYYAQQIAIRNKKGDVIKCDSIKVHQKISDFKGQLLVDQKRFLISPGLYDVAVEIQDHINNKIGLYKDELFLPAYASSDSPTKCSLALSRAILSSKILETKSEDEKKKFYVNGYLIFPNPGHIFFKEQEPEIKAYFEIYDLTPKDSTVRFSTISWIFKYRNSDSAIVNCDTVTTIYTGFIPRMSAFQILPLMKSDLYLEPGDYIWRIDVVDLNTPNKTESIVNRLKIKG